MSPLLCPLRQVVRPPPPPQLPRTAPCPGTPRLVHTMPVVSVLLWATLLTLGWRAAHAKDYVPATPRVQLSFKGKSRNLGGWAGGR